MESLEKDVEMHDGVKLLLKRMESHPEEFAGLTEPGSAHHTLATSRWHGVIARYWMVLTEKEQAAIFVALREANRENFHHAVMRTIMEDKPKQEGNEYEARWTNPVFAKQPPPNPTPEQMTLPGIPTPVEFARATLSTAPLFDTNK